MNTRMRQRREIATSDHVTAATVTIWCGWARPAPAINLRHRLLTRAAQQGVAPRSLIDTRAKFYSKASVRPANERYWTRASLSSVAAHWEAFRQGRWHGPARGSFELSIAMRSNSAIFRGSGCSRNRMRGTDCRRRLRHGAPARAYNTKGR